MKILRNAGTERVIDVMRQWLRVGNDGSVLLPCSQARQVLERLKRLCHAQDSPARAACDSFDKQTRGGEDMRTAQQLLAVAVSSIAGRNAEKAVASLFTPGGTHALKGEFAGMNDFEVMAYLVILPEQETAP